MTEAMDLAKIFQFVSPALPAVRHDIEMLRLDRRDVLVADKGCQGFEREAHVGTWH
jgi:hypothetical protein